MTVPLISEPELLRNSMQRTDWAERFLEVFASVPLTWENVFRSPEYADKTNKEVVDLLLVLRNRAIFISMKCQQDPLSRSGEKLEKWVQKNAQAALKQVQGGIRTSQVKDFCCIHQRRQRVSFKASQIIPVRALVIVETLEPVALDNAIPLEVNGIPVSYLSVNDFLNLIFELRTINDLLQYLEERGSLNEKLQRMVGHERSCFEYYLLHHGSFTRSVALQEIRAQLSSRGHDIEEIMKQKKEVDSQAEIVERVSNDLSRRLENYADGLDEATIRRYDSISERSNYLLMQDELCDLVLDERRKIGAGLSTAIEKVRAEDADMLYQAAYLDSKPDFLYILSSSKGIPRGDILSRGQSLLLSGLSYYVKKRGLFLNYTQDRDAFELVLVRDFQDSARFKELGRQLFSELKITDLPVERF